MQLFFYDDLTRLASANCGSIWSQTFSFDPFGNLSKNGTVSFQPGFTRSGSNGPMNQADVGSYDANGNLTGDGINTYTWDVHGNPVNIANNLIGNVGLTFDAFGRMVEQNRNGSYTQIVYDPGGNKLALMTGQTLARAFVPLSGGATAVYSSTGLAYYRHADWLGSSRLASLPTGSYRLYYDGAYAPYGENYAEIGTTDRSFTGENQDTISSGPYPLYDFLYREYHPTWGRWVSPDPAGLDAVDPSNPQSWNRYAYVRNNPLALVDPYGYDCAYLKQGAIDIDHVDTNTNFVDCTNNGGYWVSGQVNDVTLTKTGDLQFGYSGMDPNGNFVAITYNSYLGPNTDNSWLTAAGGASVLLNDFLAGTGPSDRNYDMKDIETRSLMLSKGVQQLNGQIEFQMCAAGKTSGDLYLTTKDAALNLPYDAVHSPTGVQVRGYSNGKWETVGPGVVSITIPNDASMNSFALHVPPSYERGQHARGGTIHQKFQFNEPFTCGD